MPDMYIGPSGYKTTDKRFAPGMAPLVEQIAEANWEGAWSDGCPTEECDWCGYGILDGDHRNLWNTWTHTGDYNLDHTCVGCTFLIRNRVANGKIRYRTPTLLKGAFG